MVMIVWFILSLFGVCQFSWIPVMIDAAVSSLVLLINSRQKNDNYTTDVLCEITIGIAVFAFYKVFCGLAISGWWILLSPIAIFVMLLVPGGITIVNLIFKSNGLISLPAWVLIIGIILDLLMLFGLTCALVDTIKSKNQL